MAPTNLEQRRALAHLVEIAELRKSAHVSRCTCCADDLALVEEDAGTVWADELLAAVRARAQKGGNT